MTMTHNQLINMYDKYEQQGHLTKYAAGPAAEMVEQMRQRLDAVQAAHQAYANELGCDVGDIHQEIRLLKKELVETRQRASDASWEINADIQGGA